MSSSTTYVASVVTAYWLVSISMVYLNKILLSNPDASIPAPMFITWFQCWQTCVICYVLGNLGESKRASGTQSFLTEFSKTKYNIKTGMAVLPLSLIFVGMVAFNNLCLQYVEVSFCKFFKTRDIIRFLKYFWPNCTFNNIY